MSIDPACARTRRPTVIVARLAASVSPVVALLAATACPLAAQVVSGRIVDSENGEAVGLSAVILLDAEREPLVMSAADVDGRYRVEAPGPGEYYLVVERLGYFENETPLFAVESDGEYAIDLEMRPEPIRLDPLEVAVRNEELEDFLTLEFGVHPATIRGYRSIQGIRLEEAKLKAEDNTDLLRWLYIPVSHGRQVCVGTYGPGAELPERMFHERINARADAAEGRDFPDSCGALYLNGYRCPNEQIEEIPLDRIAVVVALPGSVRLYTRDFDWTFRRGFEGGAC
jgi:hypothetical protein